MNKYEVLGVHKTASYQELKTAYQTAVLQTHPDKIGSSTNASDTEVIHPLFQKHNIFVASCISNVARFWDTSSTLVSMAFNGWVVRRISRVLIMLYLVVTLQRQVDYGTPISSACRHCRGRASFFSYKRRGKHFVTPTFAGSTTPC